MPATINYDVSKIAYPRDALARVIARWLVVYENARKEPNASDLALPELIDKNSRNLADYIGGNLDFFYSKVYEAVVKEVSQHAYSAGLGKPMPVFSFKKEEAVPKPHPSRAVQTVERDPQTLEVTRTVTEYQD